MTGIRLAAVLAACGAVGTAGGYVATHTETAETPLLHQPRPLGELLKVVGHTRLDVELSRENGVWRYRYTARNGCLPESGLRIQSWFVRVSSTAAPDIRTPRGWECRAATRRDAVWEVRCRALAWEQEVFPGDARSGFELTLSREDALGHWFGIRFHDGQAFESGAPS